MIRLRTGRRPLFVAAAFILVSAFIPIDRGAVADAPLSWKGEWPKTDFSNAIVDLASIRSGGPPKDGIPPIDDPVFVSVAEAEKLIAPTEPVIATAT